MKMYFKNSFGFFYDRYEKHWVLFPVDKDFNRIEFDLKDNFIESFYFYNKKELIIYIQKNGN